MLKTRLSKVLSGPGEWITAVGALITIVAAIVPWKSLNLGVGQYFDDVGLAILLAGAVQTMREIRERQQDLDKHLTNVGMATKAAIDYGAALGLIADTLRQTEADLERTPHVQAGGGALNEYALKVIPERARHLRDLLNGQFMTLVEHHYLNDFLRRLVEALPDGSTWFGITQLKNGWLKDHAEPGYREFVQLMQDRSKAGKLTVLRIYYFQSQSDIGQELRDHLEEEIKADIAVRLILGTKPPLDLSLVWPSAPGVRPTLLADPLDPVQLLRSQSLAPICGLEFTTQAGQLIRQVNVFVQASRQLASLQQEFARAWRVSVKL
jgi:hypothetical protein